MARPFHHPPLSDVTLAGVLHALADPVRLDIVRCLGAAGDRLNCTAAAPAHVAKSTQSHHYRVLREAGLIHSERRGTEVVNALRCAEIELKFPGLVPAILAAASS